MLTDLLKKKLIHFFGVFDTDQDGYIKDSDMKDVVRNLADHRDAGPGHPTTTTSTTCGCSLGQPGQDHPPAPR